MSLLLLALRKMKTQGSKNGVDLFGAGGSLGVTALQARKFCINQLVFQKQGQCSKMVRHVQTSILKWPVSRRVGLGKNMEAVSAMALHAVGQLRWVQGAGCRV